jgi:transposase
MSLKPQSAYTVPEDTRRVARAIFPNGNIYMRLYDTFGTVFQDSDFAALFAHDGQPALSPVRLIIVSILQFIEGLTDRQAADAVRTRIDWKYLLCLELTDPGFDHSVLSEFRTRLINGSAEGRLLTTLLTHFQAQGLVKARGKQRTDSTHVLGAIRAMTRLECVGETMRHALNSLAVVAPDWLRAHSQREWVERYGMRADDYHLPTSATQRIAYAEMVGADGSALLLAIYDPTAPIWLRQVPAVETLRRVWVQNYTWSEKDGVCWRQADNIPPAAVFISSPYDADARYATKRSTSWVGYKVHITETCDDDAPRLITNVETTSAPVADGAMTVAIHEALQEKGLLPADHLVDTGYLDAELLVASQEAYAVELVGPTRGDYHWQARQGRGFAAQNFVIDWARKQATCPAGKTNSSWSPAVDKRTNPVIKIKFSRKDCGACPFQAQCTTSNPPRRTVTIRPEAQYKALQVAREREQTEAFTKKYARRAGVEGTVSQGVRTSGLRRSRYIGLAKTHLQHVLTACALNIVRVMRWLAGEPLARTRQSAFMKLYAAPT